MESYLKKMETFNIQNTLTNILIDLGIPPKSIKENANFSFDLGFDSLSMTELIMSIEQTFDIEISDEDYDQITTFGTAITYIATKINFSKVGEKDIKN